MSVNQKIVQGENSLLQLPALLKENGANSIFLITGKHFKLDEHPGIFEGVTLKHFIKAGPNVDVSEVQSAYAVYSGSQAAAIVAIGGGSVIDLAKAIIHRVIEFSSPVPYFVSIPTTAGSGSEATHFAVVYRDKQKYSVVHPGILPQLVILDPVLTYSLPSIQTANCGMDAFAQAVESYWSLNATEESRQYAADSILLWKESFLPAVKDPDPEMRRQLLLAAHLAGKAINITRTTGPHALSYYLTIHYHIPHGQAVGLFLPLFFLYNKPGDELLELLGVSGEFEAMQRVRAIMKSADLATHLSELNISKENIVDRMLEQVNEERFANNPIPFDREQLKQLITEYL